MLVLLFTGGNQVGVKIRALRGEPSEPVLCLGVLPRQASRGHVCAKSYDLGAGAEKVLHRAGVNQDADAEGLARESEPKKGRRVQLGLVQMVGVILVGRRDQLRVECNVVGSLDDAVCMGRFEADLDLVTALFGELEPLVLPVQGEATEVVGEAETTRIEGVVDGLAVLWSDHIGVFCWGFPDFRGTVAWR